MDGIHSGHVVNGVDSHNYPKMIIYVDGSCVTYLGARKAGIGLWFGDGDERNTHEDVLSLPATNNVAELLAVLRAMHFAADDEHLEIVSDSQYAIYCVTRWYPGWARSGWIKSSGGSVMNKEIIVSIVELIEGRTARGFTTDFTHVRGHSGNYGNSKADALARMGLKEQRDQPQGPGTA